VVRAFGRLLLVGVAAVACTDANAPEGPARLAPYIEASGTLTSEVVPDEYIVVLRDNVIDVDDAADDAGGQVMARWSSALKGYGVRASISELAAVRRDSRVQYVSPNGRVHKTLTQSPTPSWGLDRIDQTSLPLNNSFTYPTGGSVVHAYIIDTGIRGTHTQFTGRIGAGFTSINDGNGTNDCDGHGTHVAGTVGGSTYGVAKSVILHPVRVLDCTGSGTYAQVISGINWVAQNKILPAVANMSLGGPKDNATNTASDNLVAAGVFLAVASGNSAANACNYSPASAPNATTVNSSASNDARSSFSNFGTCTDIFAPGSSIVSAYNSSNTATATLSGTSMASPHVAGAGALYLAANPSHTPAQVDAALKNNASLNKITNPGTGSPNRLLNISFLNGAPPANQLPVAAFSHVCTGPRPTGNYRCEFDASASSDPDGNIVSYVWSIVGQNGRTGSFAVWGLDPGTYSVTLTVTDNLGGSKSLTKTVVVGGSPPGNVAPVANFTVACFVRPGFAERRCAFDGTSSSDSDGSIVSYAWAMPANGTRNIAAFNWGLVPGTYSVTLTVTDDDGATGVVTKTVVVQ
jgi:subtilisin family serine protease